MKTEQQKLEAMFQELTAAEKHSFPPRRGSLKVPEEHGVYCIGLHGRSQKPQWLHVGMSTFGRFGLLGRLKGHLAGTSSFVKAKFKGDGNTLRNPGYFFIYLKVRIDRERTLLEAYTIGQLCPKHLGLHERMD